MRSDAVSAIDIQGARYPENLQKMVNRQCSLTIGKRTLSSISRHDFGWKGMMRCA
jgi:hypothetical protein